MNDVSLLLGRKKITIYIIKDEFKGSERGGERERGAGQRDIERQIE